MEDLTLTNDGVTAGDDLNDFRAEQAVCVGQNSNSCQGNPSNPNSASLPKPETACFLS